MFVDLSDQILSKKTGEIKGQSFKLRNLSNCTVYLPDFLACIYIDECQNTKIYAGPTEGSVFVRNCKDCFVSVAAQQVRLSFSTNVRAQVFSSSKVALESASNVSLGPYNFCYPGIKAHMEEVELLEKENEGYLVHDFTPREVGKNFKWMATGEVEGWVFHGGADENEKPVEWPTIFGGRQSVFLEEGDRSRQSDESMQSFQILKERADARSQIEDIHKGENQVSKIVCLETKENIPTSAADQKLKKGQKEEKEEKQIKDSETQGVSGGKEINIHRVWNACQVSNPFCTLKKLFYSSPVK